MIQGRTEDEENGNAGETVLILTWFLFLVAIFALCARVGTKYVLTKKLTWDDYTVLAAQVLYLAQCIAISFAPEAGIGKSADELSDETIDDFQKIEYVGTIFFLWTLGTVQLSICVFFRMLSPSTIHRRLNNGIVGISAAWLLSSTLTTLFQCAPPSPWLYVDNSRCVDRSAWWSYVVITNIIIEFGVMALYLLIILSLQMPAARKWVLVSVFFTRLLLVAALIAQLVEFRTAAQPDNDDVTASSWVPILCSQAVLCASVVSASLPYLKPFAESLESGVMRVPGVPDSYEALGGRATSGSGHSGSHSMSNMSSQGSRSTTPNWRRDGGEGGC